MGALHQTTMALADLLQKHRYEGSVIFGHAKDGNLHFLLNEQFDRPECIERYQQFTGRYGCVGVRSEWILKS